MSDSVGVYLNEIGKVPLLNAEEERQLSREIEAGREAAERLADFPQCGRIVPEINDAAIREIILGNYRIIYRLQAGLAEILTVFHGARLLDLGRLK